MKIAIFTPSQNPYSETFIQAHKHFLKDKVFYYYGTAGQIKLEGVESLVSKITYWRLKWLRILFKRPHAFVNKMAVASSLRNESVDVILVEYGTHAYNLLSLFKECEIPVVVHFHGYDASVYKVIEKCEQYREVFALVSKVIAVSRSMENKLLALGCPKEKLVYNVYGPNSDFETVVPNFAKKQFLAIGRFTDKKAPYYSILAFKKVAEKHPDVRFLFAGDGELKNMCQNLVRFYGLERQVEFLGVITPETYRNLLSESLAFVQHSITSDTGDMEGTPLAVLEASAAGVPVISTYHAGISDVIVHQQTGLLSEEHDVESMSQHMLSLLENFDYAKQLGNSGKIHIKTHFSMGRHILVLQKVLEQA